MRKILFLTATLILVSVKCFSSIIDDTISIKNAEILSPSLILDDIEVYIKKPCYNSSNSGLIDVVLNNASGRYSIFWYKIENSVKKLIKTQIDFIYGNDLEDLTNIGKGIYNCQIYNASCGNKEFTIAVEEEAEIIFKNPEIVHNCPDENNGFISYNKSFNANILNKIKFSWSNGQNASIINNLSDGIYFVTITAMNGCQKIEKHNIKPIRTEAIIGHSCTDQKNGFIRDYGPKDIGYDGNGYLIYKWSNGSESGRQYGLSPGSYSVTITDQKGCTLVENYLINKKEWNTTEPKINIPCYGDFGSIIFDHPFTLSNGELPLKVLWSNGSTSYNINNLDPNIYTLTVSDKQNCSIQKTYEVKPPSELIINDPQIIGVCEGKNGAEIVFTGDVAVGGSPPYTFEWSNGATSKNLFELGPGDYTILVIDSKGCSTSKTFVIDKGYGSLFTLKNIKRPLCPISGSGYLEGGHIELEIKKPGTVFSWYGSESNSNAIYDLKPGFYSVTATNSNCSQIANYWLYCCYSGQTENQNFDVRIQHSTNKGSKAGQLELLNPPNGTFEWSGPDGFISNQAKITGLKAGNYILSFFNGCSYFTSYYIIKNENECHKLKGEIEMLKCRVKNDDTDQKAKLNVKVEGSNGYKFNWSTGTKDQMIEVSNPGVYKVTIQDDNFCSIISEYEVELLENFAVNAAIHLPYTWTDCSIPGNEIAQVSVFATDSKKYQIKWDDEPYEELYWKSFRHYRKFPGTSTIKVKNQCEVKTMYYNFSCTNPDGTPCTIDIEMEKTNDCFDKCSFAEWTCSRIKITAKESGLTAILPNNDWYELIKDKTVYYLVKDPDVQYFIIKKPNGCSKTFSFDYSVICDPISWENPDATGTPDQKDCPQLLTNNIEKKGETIKIEIEYNLPKTDILPRAEVVDDFGNIIFTKNFIAFPDELNTFTIENIVDNKVTVNITYPELPNCKGFRKVFDDKITCPQNLIVFPKIANESVTASISSDEEISGCKIELHKIENNKLKLIEKKIINLSIGENNVTFNIASQPYNTSFKVILFYPEKYRKCGTNEDKFNKIKECPYFNPTTPTFTANKFKVYIHSNYKVKGNLTLFNGSEKLHNKIVSLVVGSNEIVFDYNITKTGFYNFEFIPSDNCAAILSDAIKISILKDPDPDDCKNFVAILYDVASNNLIGFSQDKKGGTQKLRGIVITPVSFDSISPHSEMSVLGDVKNVKFDLNNNLLVYSEISQSTFISNINLSGETIWTTQIPNAKLEDIPESISGNSLQILVKSYDDGSYYLVKIDNTGSIVENNRWGSLLPELTMHNNVKVFMNSSSSFSTITKTNKTLVKSYFNGNESTKEFSNNLSVENLLSVPQGLILVGQIKNSFNENNVSYYSSKYNSPIALLLDRNLNILNVNIDDKGQEIRINKSIIDQSGNVFVIASKYNNNPNDSGNNFDSCSYISMIEPSPCNCNINLINFSFNNLECKLTWSNGCENFQYILQKEINNLWTPVAADSNFYFVPNNTNGKYRLAILKPNCPTLYSNIINTSCTASCNCTPPPLTLNTSNCCLSWDATTCNGYTKTLQRLVGAAWMDVSIISPFYVNDNTNGNYRLILTKPGCATQFSNTINANCGTACNCYSPLLSYSSNTCNLTWDPVSCAGFTTKLQSLLNGSWSNVANATSPYKIPYGIPSSYRLLIEKINCASYFSNVIEETCYIDPCICQYADLDFDAQSCQLIWNENLCTDFDYQLQIKIGYVWENIQNATSPHAIASGQNGTYRLALTNDSCNDIYSAEVTTNCNDNCICTMPVLSHEDSNCTLEWDASTCSNYQVTLQYKINNIWQDISNASSPYNPTENVEHRLKATNSGCVDLFSNTKLVDCVCESCIYAFDWDRDEYITYLSEININNQQYSPPQNNNLPGDLVNVGNHLYNKNFVEYLNSLTITSDNCFEAQIPSINDFNSNCIDGCDVDEYAIAYTNIIRIKHKKGLPFYLEAATPYNFTPYFINQDEMTSNAFSTNYINCTNYNGTFTPPPYYLSKCDCILSYQNTNTSRVAYPPSIQQKDELIFEELSKKRILNSMHELPVNIRNEIKTFVKTFSPTEVWIQGSYASGKYHNSETDSSFIKIKQKVYKLKKKPWRAESDLDLYVKGLDIDSFSFKFGNIEATNKFYGNGFLIYKNGKFVDQEEDDRICNIYPNPFTKGFTIDLTSKIDENVYLEVYNSVGQLVYKDEIPVTLGENRYYLKDSELWSDGIYHAKLRSKHYNLGRKIIKIR